MISKDIDKRIQKFINSNSNRDARFMRALLVATIINQVRPKSYAIQHVRLSNDYEQYIVSEDEPADLWRNQELNYALQALIFNWFRKKENILHSYVDDGNYAIFTLTKRIKIGEI
ncbi:hypothetical protein HHK02_06985 [Limosilactobacillus reuteri]|uniref:Uncharacterized protein n=1 Tax=Limosilactobacillus reuteri TaxID=1598 RepID=A0A7L6BFP3_LIMRT|nr:hypothetical protein [Limosilactobacillus reuteri]QLQ60967.1 hypothetical protein HHK02_06985 [Limosilactobacillus reuteri]